MTFPNKSGTRRGQTGAKGKEKDREEGGNSRTKRGKLGGQNPEKNAMAATKEWEGEARQVGRGEF